MIQLAMMVLLGLGGDPLPPGAVVRLGTTRLRHPGYPRVAFLPDGKHFVSGGVDNTLRLWELPGGKEVRRFKGHYPWVSCVVVSHNGKIMASAGADDTIRLWEPLSGKLLREIEYDKEQDSVRALAFSPDDSILAAAMGSGRYAIHLYQHEKGTALRPLSLNDDVSALAFLPGGQQLASTGRDGTVRIWEVKTGRLLEQFTLEKYKKLVSLAISADGKYLVAASTYQEPAVYVWDLVQKQEAYRLSWPRDNIFSPSFVLLPGGKSLAATQPDGSLVVRDLATGKEQRRFTMKTRDLRREPRGIALSPDGRTLAGMHYSGIRFWNIESGKELHSFSGHYSPVYALAFSPDDKTIATGGEEGAIFLWDRAGKLRRTIHVPGSHLSTLVFTPDGKHLLSQSDSFIRMWEVASGKEVRRFGYKDGHTNHSAISPDGRRVAIARQFQETALSVYDTVSGKQLFSLPFPGVGHSLAFSPDGKTLAHVWTDDRGEHWLEFHDAQTGKLLRRLTPPPPPPQTNNGTSYGIDQMRYSPDGRMLVVTVHWSVHFWEVATGKERFSFPMPDDGSGTTLAVSPDGKVLVLGASGLDHSFCLWDLMANKKLARIDRHQGMISALAFSRDGKYLATGNGDSTVLIWDVPTLLKTGKVNDN